MSIIVAWSSFQSCIIGTLAFAQIKFLYFLMIILQFAADQVKKVKVNENRAFNLLKIGYFHGGIDKVFLDCT
jgi:hypothetical protein